MILLDSNLLIYATAVESEHYATARNWLGEVLQSGTRVGMPWATVLSFLRLLGNRAVVRTPPSPAEAWGVASRWLAIPNVWIPEPTERHGEVLSRLLADCGRSDLVPDAHLAALAIEHGLTLMSADGDFARFPGLRWVNPIAKVTGVHER